MIEGFLYIPLEHLREHIDELPMDKDIICTCQYGTRAYEAYTMLKDKGFKRIRYMECGMFG
ncbi:MAG: rhodanese-like domain-containing protein, partial [bacterium]